MNHDIVDDYTLRTIRRIGRSLAIQARNYRPTPRSSRSPRNSDFIPHIQACLRPDVMTILDVGCGKLWDGNPPAEDYLLSIFSSSRFHITGIDIFPECIEWRQKNGPPGDYIHMDALEARERLGRKFDLVIAHHVIEHFDKETSRGLIRDIESMAMRQVIVGALVGFTNTDYAVELHGNEWERHKFGWTPDEFVAMRYSIVYVYAGAFLAHKELDRRIV